MDTHRHYFLGHKFDVINVDMDVPLKSTDVSIFDDSNSVLALCKHGELIKIVEYQALDFMSIFISEWL